MRILIICFTLLFTGTASANLIVGISDTVNGIKFEWSGSIDTSNLVSIGPFNNSGGIQTSRNLVFSSSTASNGEWFRNVGLTGPVIGSAAYQTFANVLSGDFFAIHQSLDSIIMPTGYISGDNILGSVEFNGPTIASLGIGAGPYVFTMSESVSTITIQQAVMVSTPLSIVLFSLGLVGISFSRKMKRTQ
jgi:hypothetical protein